MLSFARSVRPSVRLLSLSGPCFVLRCAALLRCTAALHCCAARRDVAGGMDYILNFRLIECFRLGIPPDMNVYDAAAWSAPGPLSEISVSKALPFCFCCASTTCRIVFKTVPFLAVCLSSQGRTQRAVAAVPGLHARRSSRTGVVEAVMATRVNGCHLLLWGIHVLAMTLSCGYECFRRRRLLGGGGGGGGSRGWGGGGGGG
eukprot:SAG22_NODE_1157_length_5331_cov_1.886086_2_plen_202_part_00